MDVRDWLEPLPEDLRWERVTWIEAPPHPPALLGMTETTMFRFEPTDIAWYEELNAALDRDKRPIPLFRAALPTLEHPERQAAFEIIETCANEANENTDALFSTAGRLLCATAPETRDTDGSLLGSACVSLALQLRYDTTQQYSRTLVRTATNDEFGTDRYRFGEAANEVYDAVGRTNAIRITTTEKHAGVTTLPVADPKNIAQRKL